MYQWKYSAWKWGENDTWAFLPSSVGRMHCLTKVNSCCFHISIPLFHWQSCCKCVCVCLIFVGKWKIGEAAHSAEMCCWLLVISPMIVPFPCWPVCLDKWMLSQHCDVLSLRVLVQGKLQQQAMAQDFQVSYTLSGQATGSTSVFRLVLFRH